ncbi:MAG: ATP-binding cassette domain-containing protein [Chloroflexi bacterium]|nr:ATP-binding cassette domain-containing protein [Chloroflexota bacterium]
MVSHDQTFLDNVVNEILEVEGERITPYHGNYTNYVRERSRRQKAAEAAAKRRESEMTKHRQFIQRFGANAAWATQVRSHEKMLARLEQEHAEEVASAPVRRRPVTFRFPPAANSGRVVCEVRDLTKSYDNQVVLAPLSFIVERGERIALVGPNGAGKSTLMRLLARLEPHDAGSISFGPQIAVAYFAQHQADVLDPDRTVLDEAAADAPAGIPSERIREALGRMLFKGEMMTARVGQLSGGERARLALAKMLLIPANLLLLDEPTNHLDIPSKEALEAALSTYEGAIIVASHDRYFLQRLDTSKLIVLEGPGAMPLTRLGSYEDWRDMQARIEEAERQLEREREERSVALAAEQLGLSEEITRLERERERVAQQLADPSAFKEDDIWGGLLEKYQKIDARLSGLLARQQSYEAADGDGQAQPDPELASVSE